MPKTLQYVKKDWSKQVLKGNVDKFWVKLANISWKNFERIFQSFRKFTVDYEMKICEDFTLILIWFFVEFGLNFKNNIKNKSAVIHARFCFLLRELSPKHLSLIATSLIPVNMFNFGLINNFFENCS